MMSHEGSKGRKKLFENILFGASGILFTFLIVGDIIEYFVLISSRLPIAFAGLLFSIISFYFFESTNKGSKIGKLLRRSKVFTGVITLILLLLFSYIMINTSIVSRSSLIVFLIGYSIMLPIISLIAYLW